MSTKQKSGTSRSSKKKTVVTAPSTDDVTKTKPKTDTGQKEKPETPEKARLRTRTETLNPALQSAFGTTKFDSGSPPAVLGDLAFDSTKLTELAVLLKDDADQLSKKNTPAQFKIFTDRLDRFTGRVTQARQIAARLKQVNDTAAGLNVKLTDSDFADAWQSYDNATKAGDLDQANGSLGELEARLTMLSDVIKAYNAKSKQAPVTKVPMGLYIMAGKSMPLDVLRRGLALVPDLVPTVDALRGLLASADPPSALPGLVRLADQAGVRVGEALNGFSSRVDNATNATNALRAIVNSGKTADFFLTGQGSQSWSDLAYIGRHNLKPWTGGAQQGLVLGPPGDPIQFDELHRQSIPLPKGRKHLLDAERGQDPGRPRYVGNKPFINDGIKRGVMLPRSDSQGRLIQYTEYDIRPYVSPAARGDERLVVGNGRWFYTADHYKNFVEIQ